MIAGSRPAMNTLQKIDAELVAGRPPAAFRPGDTVKVHVRIQEGEKSRVQVFEGTVIGMHRSGASTTYTVRKVSYGVGVERIFPLYSPWVEKVEFVSRKRTRRAKLYFLRERTGKQTRLTEIKD
jgi:large subunit ribosomal protein L19